MHRLKRRHVPQTILRSRFLTIGLMAIALAVSLAVGREIARRVSVQQELDRLRREITTAERSTHELEKLISTVKSSTFQEGAARTRFNLQKAGEKVLAIPNLQGETAEAPSASSLNAQVEEKDHTNARRWWEFLFTPKSS